MNPENLIGVALGIKLVNGNLKPRFNKGTIVMVIIEILLFIGFLGAFVYGLLNANMEFIIMGGLGIFGFGYVLLVTPYTQNSKNYYIEFQSENSLVGFKLSYKGKVVKINYKIDKEGKIAFANNQSKLECISYEDGSKMSNLIKYKIINYFTKWLHDNNLMSNEITTTFESL